MVLYIALMALTLSTSIVLLKIGDTGQQFARSTKQAEFQWQNPLRASGRCT